MRAFAKGLAMMAASLMVSMAMSSAASAQSASEIFAIGSKQMKAKEYTAARITMKAACAAGSAKGCLDYGWMQSKGHGGAFDKAVARTYYRKSCDLGVKRGIRKGMLQPCELIGRWNRKVRAQ